MDKDVEPKVISVPQDEDRKDEVSYNMEEEDNPMSTVALPQEETKKVVISDDVGEVDNSKSTGVPLEKTEASYDGEDKDKSVSTVVLPQEETHKVEHSEDADDNSKSTDIHFREKTERSSDVDKADKPKSTVVLPQEETQKVQNSDDDDDDVEDDGDGDGRHKLTVIHPHGHETQSGDAHKPTSNLVHESEHHHDDSPEQEKPTSKTISPNQTEDAKDDEQPFNNKDLSNEPISSPEMVTMATDKDPTNVEIVVAPLGEFDTIDLDDGLDDIDDHGANTADKEANLKPKDDVDAASVYSLFMETDFRYYFQHPYCRLFIAYFVTFCNFLIYAEDPVAHSRKECTIPVIGNDFAFLFARYPPNAWSLLKVVLWFSAIIIGCIIGKIFFHTLLFNRWIKLKMFSDDRGSWLTMFFCVLLSLFVISWLYNAFLLIGGAATLPYRISPLLGISNAIFTKAAACGTWCGDFFTAWMVTDMMLQEKLYPMWAAAVRKWWMTRYNRIVLFWVVTTALSISVIFFITTDYISWDKLNHGFLPTNEVSRSFLASFILVMDLVIVMQDWDFPHFIGAIDIKLPGINTAHIHFQIPKILRKEHWQVHITGKWFNYGVLFLVLILDLNMWKNQMFYKPFEYGQYVDGDGRIHTAYDPNSLTAANSTQLSFLYRNATIDPQTNQTFISNDNVMNTRFYDYPLAAKGMAFVPSLLAFVIFGFVIFKFGRFVPSKDDPYAGRLRKRRKKRFSARKHWQRLQNRIRTSEPILMYFKKQDIPRERKPSETHPHNWNVTAS